MTKRYPIIGVQQRSVPGQFSEGHLKRDVERCLGASLQEKRDATDVEAFELQSMTMLRGWLKNETITIKQVRKICGGKDDETTIQRAARTMAYHLSDAEVLSVRDPIQPSTTLDAVKVPGGLREFIASLKGGPTDDGV